MICGLDDIKSTIVLFFILAFSSIIVYYFHERVQYLEHSVSRQNQVLSDFISNVQRQVVNSSHLGNSSDIKIVKSDEMDKIVISEDEDDSDSDSDSDTESDDDDDSEADIDTDADSERDDTERDDTERDDTGRDNDSDTDTGRYSSSTDKKNIKVIELIDKDDEYEEESHLQEVHNDDLHISQASASSDNNVKKIELVQKEDKTHEDGGDGDMDVVGSKKLSVAELRALVVSKGLANQNSANKMKKLELVEALQKL
jgi:hypothetical protein